MAVYDEIGSGYDGTRKADPYITARMIHLLDVHDRGPYLDAACGTGNYTVAMAARTGGEFHGIDISERMLEIARSKSRAIHWSLGDVMSLPYEDGTFSGATCILAIHHLEDLGRAFKELFRVIFYGRLVIFTSDRKQMEGYWLNEYFPEMMRRSMAKMPSLDDVSLALETAGFENLATETYDVLPDLQDWFLYCGKHEPRMYFDPAVRQGSSGFAIYADGDEVERGLAMLSRDIEAGKIDEVIESYRNDNGDYLFVVAEKALAR